MSEHASIPWAVQQEDGDLGCDIYDRAGFLVADTYSETESIPRHQADAAHIVKCVNHHDELVAALDELVTFADISVTAHDSDLISAIANARHYLAKVQS